MPLPPGRARFFVSPEARRDQGVRRTPVYSSFARGDNSLSRYQLFARDFAGALASVEAGKELDGTNLLLDTNRAHALLFLGRTREADAVYLGNRGKKLDPKQDKAWEQVILKDLDDLEAAGLTNPEIPRIRKMLSPGEK